MNRQLLNCFGFLYPRKVFEVFSQRTMSCHLVFVTNPPLYLSQSSLETHQNKAAFSQARSVLKNFNIHRTVAENYLNKISFVIRQSVSAGGKWRVLQKLQLKLRLLPAIHITYLLFNLKCKEQITR